MGERSNDDLGTPRWILELVRQMGPIAVDPCSNAWSIVCPTFHEWRGESPDDDGLEGDWYNKVSRDIDHGSVFVNPPYSCPLPWAKKIAAEHARGCEVFALVKCAPTTQWWKVLVSCASARIDFHKRITFDGGRFKSGQIDSTMFYCGHSPYLFAHIFAPHGEVRVYR